MSTTRPMRADAARNRAVLIDAARTAFSRNGVTASLDDIARAASVGPGTLYRHFPTRDELVLAVVEESLSELYRLGMALLNDRDPLDALHRWLGAYIEEGSTFEGLARTLASRPPDPDDASACRLARDAGIALVRRAVDAGLLRDDVDGRDVLDLATAIAWIGDRPDRDGDQRARLLGVIIDGLRAQPMID